MRKLFMLVGIVASTAAFAVDATPTGPGEATDTQIDVGCEIGRAVSVTFDTTDIVWTGDSKVGATVDADAIAADNSVTLDISTNADLSIDYDEGGDLYNQTPRYSAYSLSTRFSDTGTGILAPLDWVAMHSGYDWGTTDLARGVGKLVIAAEMDRNGLTDPYGIYAQNDKMLITVTELP